MLHHANLRTTIDGFQRLPSLGIYLNGRHHADHFSFGLIHTVDDLKILNFVLVQVSFILQIISLIIGAPEMILSLLNWAHLLDKFGATNLKIGYN
jgi:hypothetical protein